MYMNVAGKAQNLFSAFNQTKNNQAKADALANPLFSWHVNYFTAKRQKNVVFLNDASTLAVVVYNVNEKNKGKLQVRFEENLAAVWQEIGLPEDLLKRYLQAGGSWQVNKSISRSAIASTALLCREVGEELIGQVDAPTMGLEMTKRLRRVNQKPLFLDDTVRLFIAAAPFKWQQATNDGVVIDRRALREIIRRLRKNGQADPDEHTPSEFEEIIKDIQRTNDELIAMFIENERDKHSPKTVDHYQDSLTFYLNHWLAFHFQTILSVESTAIADLLYHGSSANEVVQVRRAMKELLKFLADNGAVTSEWYKERKMLLNQEDLSADALTDFADNDDVSWAKRDGMMFNDSGDPTLPTIFDKETDKMIDDYFTAFASLYGLIPTRHAYQIITSQNPELGLRMDKFQSYVEERVSNRNLRYLIFNMAQLADERQLNGSFADELFIVYPTIIADSRRLVNLYNHQLGLQYYVPKKSKMMRFAEDGYFDLGELHNRLRDMFITNYELTGSNLYAAIYLSLFGLKLDQYEDLDLVAMTRAIKKVIYMLNDSIHLGIENTAEHEQLIKLLFFIENKIRRPYDRGWTCMEMRDIPTLAQVVEDSGATLTNEEIFGVRSGQIDRQELIEEIEGSNEIPAAAKEKLKKQIEEI